MIYFTIFSFGAVCLVFSDPDPKLLTDTDRQIRIRINNIACPFSNGSEKLFDALGLMYDANRIFFSHLKT